MTPDKEHSMILENPDPEWIRADQQVRLLANRPLASVLTEVQLRYIEQNGILLAENHASRAPCDFFQIHSIDACDNRVYRFSTRTLSPKWHVDVFVHSSGERLLNNVKFRSRRPVDGLSLDQTEPGQKESLLTALHFSTPSLTELVVIHEAVHAGALLARTLDVIAAKKLAAKVTTSQSTIKWREEIQCRTVEIISKEIVSTLALWGIPCTPMKDASL